MFKMFLEIKFACMQINIFVQILAFRPQDETQSEDAAAEAAG
jgi:hypothetical protein